MAHQAVIRPPLSYAVYLTVMSGLMAGIPFISVLLTDGPQWLALVLAVTAIIFSVFCFYRLRTMALILRPDRIEHQGFFSNRTLATHDIEGIRNIGDGPVLVAKKRARSMALPSWALQSDELREWGRCLPNLDWLEHQEEMQTALVDPTLGHDVSTREATLQRGAVITRILGWAGLILSLWVLVFPLPFLLAMGVGLAAPILAFLLKLIKPDFFAFMPINRLGMPVGLIPLLLIGAALAMPAGRYMLPDNVIPSLVVALGSAVILTLLAIQMDSHLRPMPAIAVVLALIFAWIWGGAIICNVWRDQSGVLRPLRIAFISDDDVLNAATLDGREHRLKAPPSIANAARNGGDICLLERDGRLGWRHHRLYTCQGLKSDVTSDHGADPRS